MLQINWKFLLTILQTKYEILHQTNLGIKRDFLLGVTKWTVARTSAQNGGSG